MRIFEQDASPARKDIFKRLHVPLLFQFKGVYISYHVAMLKPLGQLLWPSLEHVSNISGLGSVWWSTHWGPKLHVDCFAVPTANLSSTSLGYITMWSTPWNSWYTYQVINLQHPSSRLPNSHFGLFSLQNNKNRWQCLHPIDTYHVKSWHP